MTQIITDKRQNERVEIALHSPINSVHASAAAGTIWRRTCLPAIPVFSDRQH
jgi:hypothetical protein